MKVETPASTVSTEEEWVRLVESQLRPNGGSSAQNNNLRWETITEGGSDRKFYRVKDAQDKSCIVMRYDETKPENSMYVDIAKHLRDLGLPTPRILFHHQDQRIVGLEDLGSTSLHTIFHRDPQDPLVDLLYQRALDAIRKLHQHREAPVRMMHGFDEPLYRWERDYFIENLVVRWANIHLPSLERAEIESEMETVSTDLLKRPRSLIHRDFQSQNLMIRDQQVWLIDFQGMRLGHPAYDIASLLYDPYVDLGRDRRKKLLHYYEPNSSKFDRSFYQAAAQRLMQALGAYGFLGLVKGKPSFLRHIPQALQNLAEILEELGNMQKTLQLVQRIRSEKHAFLHSPTPPLNLPTKEIPSS
jgi:aminoglycoside/choline kinase family phosphotransferase